MTIWAYINEILKFLISCKIRGEALISRKHRFNSWFLFSNPSSICEFQTSGHALAETRCDEHQLHHDQGCASCSPYGMGGGQGLGAGGYEGKKTVCVPKMGLSFWPIYSEFHFTPKGLFLWFWVGGWVWPGGGGVHQITPPPRTPFFRFEKSYMTLVLHQNATCPCRELTFAADGPCLLKAKKKKKGKGEWNQLLPVQHASAHSHRGDQAPPCLGCTSFQSCC